MAPGVCHPHKPPPRSPSRPRLGPSRRRLHTTASRKTVTAGTSRLAVTRASPSPTTPGFPSRRSSSGTLPSATTANLPTATSGTSWQKATAVVLWPATTASPSTSSSPGTLLFPRTVLPTSGWGRHTASADLGPDPEEWQVFEDAAGLHKKHVFPKLVGISNILYPQSSGHFSLLPLQIDTQSLYFGFLPFLLVGLPLATAVGDRTV